MTPRRRRQRFLRGVGNHGLLLVSALVFYYYVPVDFEAPHPVRNILFFAAALALLIWLIARQLVKQIGAGSDPGVRIRSLIILMYPVIVLFALTYYVIEVRNPAAFVGLTTRTDSLYYTVVTLGTVGYGDVHPTDSLAKVIAMVQILFDLVVIGALVSVASSRFQVVPRQLRRLRKDAGTSTAGTEPEPGGDEPGGEEPPR